MISAQPASSPRVSVVMTVFNGERHLREAIFSIQAQTLIDFEAIIVDDGSTDGSRKIIDEFVAQDERFICVAGPSIGSAGAARNVGLEMAKGRFISFLDADDIFSPSLLQKLADRAEAHDADVVLTGFSSLDDETGEIRRQRWGLRSDRLPAAQPFAPREAGKFLFYGVNPAAWSKLFRTEFVRERGLRFQSLRRSNDTFFTYAAIALASKISMVDESLITYRTGNALSLQGSIDKTPTEFAEALRALQETVRLAGLLDDLDEPLASLAVRVGVGALQRANTYNSVEATHRALVEGVFPLYGVLDRAPEAFAVPSLAEQVKQVMSGTAGDWLMRERRSAQSQAKRATDEVAKFREELATRHQHHRGLAGLEPSIDTTSRDSSADRPDVSIVVPIYNAERWLDEALSSALAQTGVDLEVICVDDGSTDSSREVVNSYATADDRVRVVVQENAGQAAARNAGAAHARGRYIAYLDSDDYYRSDAFGALVSTADRDNLDVLMFDGRSFRDEGVADDTWSRYADYYGRRVSFSAIDSGLAVMADMRRAGAYRVSPCLYIARRDFIASEGLSFRQGMVHEDDLYTFQLLMRARRVCHTASPIYARRVRPDSTMTTENAQGRSALGYLTAYAGMLRELSSVELASSVRAQVVGIVDNTFAAFLRNYRATAAPGEVDRLMAAVDMDAVGLAVFEAVKRTERKLK